MRRNKDGSRYNTLTRDHMVEESQIAKHRKGSQVKRDHKAEEADKWIKDRNEESERERKSHEEWKESERQRHAERKKTAPHPLIRGIAKIWGESFDEDGHPEPVKGNRKGGVIKRTHTENNDDDDDHEEMYERLMDMERQAARLRERLQEKKSGERAEAEHHERFRELGRGGSSRKRALGGGIHIKKSHRGLLHADLGVPQGQKIPAIKLAAAKKSPNPALRKRATFALNAKKWHHE